MIKNNYDLPYATHRYISQEMLTKPHIRVCLLKRFVKFYGKLKLCTKPQVVHLFRIQKHDFRSSFGRNCMYLCTEMNVDRIEDVVINNISMPIKTEVQDAWRIPFLKDLLSVKRGNSGGDLSKTEIQDIINYICCN